MRGSNPERPKILLDYKGAADALSLTEQALRDLVYKGRGPTVTEIGRRRLFALTDLDEFVQRHRRPAPARGIKNWR
jgi:hypothetical protein